MLLILLWSFVSFLYPAHGDIHERILKMTAQIKVYPDSTALYLIRGELYELHGDIKEAEEDFYFCLDKGLVSERIFLGLSKTQFAQNFHENALSLVEQALAINKTNPACLAWKCIVLQSLEEYCLSADTYDFLLSITSNPSPSLYVNASSSRMSCKDSEAEEKAIAILKSGLHQLGRVVVLEKALVNVYLQYHKYNEAIDLQTEMIDNAPVKADPYFQRAKTFIAKGDIISAKNDLYAALNAIDELPRFKSNTGAMKSLRRDILSMLNATTN